MLLFYKSIDDGPFLITFKKEGPIPNLYFIRKGQKEKEKFRICSIQRMSNGTWLNPNKQNI